MTKLLINQKEPPIIFTGESVRGILAGIKSQTRRVIVPQPNYMKRAGESDEEMFANIAKRKCPYGKVGDTLWVREGIYGKLPANDQQVKPLTYYKADNAKIILHFDDGDSSPVGWDYKSKFLPGRYMQKRLARIFLEITGIRVERVQDISGKDAQKEGWSREQEMFPTINTNDKAKRWFQIYWDSINSKRGYGWDVNPQVYVIEFKRQKPTNEQDRLRNELIDMQCAITGWQEGLAFNSADDLISALDEMITKILKDTEAEVGKD